MRSFEASAKLLRSRNPVVGARTAGLACAPRLFRVGKRAPPERSSALAHVLINGANLECFESGLTSVTAFVGVSTPGRHNHSNPILAKSWRRVPRCQSPMISGLTTLRPGSAFRIHNFTIAITLLIYSEMSSGRGTVLI